jgi:CBS domain-containing protein
MRPPPACLTPGLRLVDALPVLMQSELRNVPVVNNLDEKRLVGSLSRAAVLAIFSEAIAEKSRATG